MERFLRKIETEIKKSKNIIKTEENFYLDNYTTERNKTLIHLKSLEMILKNLDKKEYEKFNKTQKEYHQEQSEKFYKMSKEVEKLYEKYYSDEFYFLLFKDFIKWKGEFEKSLERNKNLVHSLHFIFQVKSEKLLNYYDVYLFKIIRKIGSFVDFQNKLYEYAKQHNLSLDDLYYLTKIAKFRCFITVHQGIESISFETLEDYRKYYEEKK